MSHDKNKNGYQICLNGFIDHLTKRDSRYSDLEVTAQGFSKAQRKLPYTVLEKLCEETAKSKEDSTLTFKGFEVVALDGTGFTVPDTSDLGEHFNKHKTYDRSAYLPQEKIVAAVHTRTKTISHAMVDCLHSCERTLTLDLINNFKPNTLFILDRGLSTKKIFELIYNKGQHVVARIRTDDSAYRPFKNFSLFGKKQEYIRLESGVCLRLVKINSTKGHEPIYLATTLPESMADEKQLEVLYKKRWEVETIFDYIKSIQGLERFHARDYNGVMQEIFAHFTLHNLTALCFPKEETQNRLINRKQMLDEVGRKVLVLCVIGLQFKRSDLAKVIRNIQKVAERSRRKKRPGRMFPRISKQPCNKWSEGKRRTKELQRFRTLS